MNKLKQIYWGVVMLLPMFVGYTWHVIREGYATGTWAAKKEMDKAVEEYLEGQ